MTHLLPGALSLGGEAVDIDLAQANRDKLRKLLAPYFHRGREVKRPGGGETAKIREWLKSNGPELGHDLALSDLSGR